MQSLVSFLSASICVFWGNLSEPFVGTRRGIVHRSAMRADPGLFCALQLLGFVWCAGTSVAALSVASDFESGSAQVIDIQRADQRIRISPAGDPRRGMPNWWFLRIDGIETNKALVLEVVARDVQLPGSNPPNQRLSPAWTLPERAAISMDGTTWAQTGPGERKGNLAVYRVNSGSPTIWIAWGPPFTPGDANRFVDRIAKDYPFAKPFTLAQSREGRRVPALRISDGAKSPGQRPAVWIQARQHAWECGGSWVAVGLTEWLVSNDASAVRLRQNAEIFVLPILDVDQVATGDGGKHALPQDHNLDWSDAPYWPEIRAAQEQLRRLDENKRLAVYLDLHNPSAGQKRQSFYLSSPPDISESTARLQERFLAGTRRLFGDIQLHDTRPATPEDRARWRPGAGLWLRQNCGPQLIAFAVETPWNTPDGTINGYRETGRKLGIAVEEYLTQFPAPSSR